MDIVFTIIVNDVDNGNVSDVLSSTLSVGDEVRVVRSEDQYDSVTSFQSNVIISYEEMNFSTA